MGSSKPKGGRGWKTRGALLLLALGLGGVSVLNVTDPALPTKLEVSGAPAEIRDQVASFWGVPIGVGTGFFGSVCLLGAVAPKRGGKKGG